MIFDIMRFHKPDEENGYLSNWYIRNFTIAGKTYCCVEQYMMEQKALLFNDYEIANQIMAQTDPQEMQKLGRQVENFHQVVWDAYKQLIVYKALLAKFEQNPDLMRDLLNTKTSTFVECSRSDKVWGIGLGMHDEIRYIEEWPGQNLLGFTLVQVRAELMDRFLKQYSDKI